MSETPRDQRALWNEVNRSFEELGDALRVHLSPDAARRPSDPTWAPDSPADPGSGPGAGPGSGPSAGNGSGSAGGAGSGPGPGAGPAAGSGRPESAPWADPADVSADPDRPGESDGPADPWADVSADPGRPGESEGPVDPWAAATADADAESPGSASGSGTAGASGTSGGSGGSGASGGSGGSGTWGSSGASGPFGASQAAEEAGWRRWSSGRFASGADWESARESVRNLGESAQRFATQAGDAARDPQVRESAQRVARSLGDAIATTAQEIATELRERMGSPRWSDPDTPAERPPVAPIEDDDPPHPTP